MSGRAATTTPAPNDGLRARRRGRTGVLLCLALALCAAPVTAGLAQDASPSRAQSRRTGHWGLTSALGYMGLLGTAGVGVGVLGDDIGAAVIGGGLGGIVGLLAGSAVGRHASKDIDEGRPVSPGRATAVRVGTLFSGVPIALGTSFLLIENGNSSGTPLGSDESTVGVLLAAGVAFGGYYLWRHGGELSSANVTAGRHRSLPDGPYVYDLGLRVRF